MNAWSLTRRGHVNDVLEYGSLPIPDTKTLQPNELLVQVSHASLQPFGYILMWAVPMFMRKSPAVAEFDFSGRVAATGRDVSLKVGDDVFGVVQPASHLKGRGTLAEYVVVTKDEVTYKPNNISFEEAAALPTGAVTAMFLMSKSGLKSGDRVLINGGSGGAGLPMIQAARRLVGDKGIIVTTCSAANTDLVKEFGADEVHCNSSTSPPELTHPPTPTNQPPVQNPPHVIDYTPHPPRNNDQTQRYSSTPFAAIADVVGTSEDLYRHSPAYLAPGKPFLEIGTYLGDAVTLGNLARTVGARLRNTLWPAVLGGTPRQWIFVQGELAGREYLEMVRGEVEGGGMRARIDGVFEMRDAKMAYARIQSRRARGKVVVHVQDLEKVN